MAPFNKTNLQNIKNIFAAQTGVELPARRYYSPKKIAVIAAVIVCCLGLTAFAVSSFSTISGDELSMKAAYAGEGIVTVQIENRSDKDLRLEPKLKLMYGRYQEEVPALAGEVLFDKTFIPAKAKEYITADISAAYDVEMLEQPLSGDYYYLLLTNDAFLTGQKWACNISFQEVSSANDTLPLTSEPGAVKDIWGPLQPYFQSDTADIFERRTQAYEYFDLVASLLEQEEIDLVLPVSPSTMVGGIDQTNTFDPPLSLSCGFPQDGSQVTVNTQWHNLDGYGKAVGAVDTDKVWSVSGYFTPASGENAVSVPLVYFIVYPAEEAAQENAHAFIRGRLLSFDELAPRLVYEDEYYLCYEVTHFFYGDIEYYLQDMLAETEIQLSDVLSPAQAIAEHYTDRDVLAGAFYYPQ